MSTFVSAAQVLDDDEARQTEDRAAILTRDQPALPPFRSRAEVDEELHVRRAYTLRKRGQSR